MTPKDIVEGTERLRGTNVYEISINRSKELQSAKTWQGISNYFSFVYVYSDNGECREVKAQEQTGVGPSTKLTRREIERLWSESRSNTGSTSEFGITKGLHKAPLIDKNKTVPVAPEQQQQIQTQETDNNIRTCDHLIKCTDCRASFLRPGNLDARKESKVCKNRQKTKRALAAGQNVIKEDEIVNLSLQKAKRFKDPIVDKSDAKVNLEKENQSQWNKIIQGTALKSHQPMKKSVRFSKLQISVMIKCYDKGKDLSKRYTPAMCQKEMRAHPELGPQNTITENQIKSFWNRHDRAQTKQNNKS